MVEFTLACPHPLLGEAEWESEVLTPALRIHSFFNIVFDLCFMSL